MPKNLIDQLEQEYLAQQIRDIVGNRLTLALTILNHLRDGKRVNRRLIMKERSGVIKGCGEDSADISNRFETPSDFVVVAAENKFYEIAAESKQNSVSQIRSDLPKLPLQFLEA